MRKQKRRLNAWQTLSMLDARYWKLYLSDAPWKTVWDAHQKTVRQSRKYAQRSY